MSLTATVRLLGEQAKYAPDTIDAGDVRAVCLRVLEVLELLCDITHISVTPFDDGNLLTLSVAATIDFDCQPFAALAGISDQ